MFLSSIKKIFSKPPLKVTEFKYSTAGDVELKDIGDDNSFENFLKTLTEEQRNMNPLHLNSDLIYQYVAALYQFQIEVIPDEMQRTSKAFVIVANNLLQNNLKNLNFDINFAGSKYEVQEEQFQIFINDSSSIPDYKPLSGENSVTLEDGTHKKEPKEKLSQFIEQKDNVLHLVDTLKSLLKLEDNSQNAQTLLFMTSNILHVMESTSLYNAAETKVELEDLIHQNVSTGVSYSCKILRKEIDYPIVSNPNKYKLT